MAGGAIIHPFGLSNPPMISTLVPTLARMILSQPPGVAVLASFASGACIGAMMVPIARRTLRQTTVPAVGAAVSIVLTAAIFAALMARFGPTVGIGPGLALAVVGPPLAMVDVLERRLPTALVAVGFALGFIAIVVVALSTSRPEVVGAAALGVLAVGGAYFAIALGSAGGLGSGDVRLAGLIGLVLSSSGWSSILMATVATWVLAAVVALGARLRSADRPPEIPLGPFLVIGAVVGLLVYPHS